MIDVALLLGKPFFAVSSLVAALGWIIAFSGTCAAANAFAVDAGAWLLLMFNLLLLSGVVLAVTSDSLVEYRLVLLAFSSVNVVFLTVQASTVQSSVSAHQAMGSGFIFLDIVFILWLFAFGAEEGTTAYQYTAGYSSVPATTHVKHGFGGAPAGLSRPAMATTTSSGGGATLGAFGSEYPLRAEALYAYTANPEDPNEISFAQGEILEIADNKGKWWQARNRQGIVGIAPSNYLKLLT